MDRIRETFHQHFITWALRVRPPESAPIVLTQRRVYVLPTRAGLAYAASLLVMLVGAINYNLSLGYALTFLLAGLGVSAILNTFRNQHGLRISPGRCDPVFCGELAHFALLIENDRAERRCAIRLNLPGQPPAEFDLAASAVAIPMLSLVAKRRGWLALPRVTISTTYPLGLVRAWSYAVPDQQCLVYPAPARMAPPPPAATGVDNGQAANANGLDDFYGLRSHQPGDSPRHVAWKAVARQDGPLLTKQFAGPAQQHVALEWDALPASMGTEQRLSVLTHWIFQAHGAGNSWSLRIPGCELGAAHGEAHYHACLKALALYDQPD